MPNPTEGGPTPCAWCGVDTTPPDGEWITCPNARDLCIDCCGEDH